MEYRGQTLNLLTTKEMAKKAKNLILALLRTYHNPTCSHQLLLKGNQICIFNSAVSSKF